MRQKAIEPFLAAHSSLKAAPGPFAQAVQIMSEQHESQFDGAVSRRLAKLRDHRPDLSSLESRLEAKLNPPLRIFVFRARTMALAASVAAIGLALGIILAHLQRPQHVSVAQLAQIHSADMSGASMTPVSTVADVDRELKTQWADAPVVTQVGLPLKSCCVHSIGRKKMACLCVELNGQPATVAIGRRTDISVADWPTMSMNGMTCRCCTEPGQSPGMNAVATERNGMVIMMFGQQPRDELLKAINEVRL